MVMRERESFPIGPARQLADRLCQAHIDSVLSDAIAGNKLDVIGHAIDFLRIDPNSRTSANVPLLILAIKSGAHSSFKKLLDKNADPAMAYENRTAMDLALEMGDRRGEDFAKRILETHFILSAANVDRATNWVSLAEPFGRNFIEQALSMKAPAIQGSAIPCFRELSAMVGAPLALMLFRMNIYSSDGQTGDRSQALKSVSFGPLFSKDVAGLSLAKDYLAMAGRISKFSSHLHALYNLFNKAMGDRHAYPESEVNSRAFNVLLSLFDSEKVKSKTLVEWATKELISLDAVSKAEIELMRNSKEFANHVCKGHSIEDIFQSHQSTAAVTAQKASLKPRQPINTNPPSIWTIYALSAGVLATAILLAFLSLNVNREVREREQNRGYNAPAVVDAARKDAVPKHSELIVTNTLARPEPKKVTNAPDISEEAVASVDAGKGAERDSGAVTAAGKDAGNGVKKDVSEDDQKKMLTEKLLASIRNGKIVDAFNAIVVDGASYGTDNDVQNAILSRLGVKRSDGYFSQSVLPDGLPFIWTRDFYLMQEIGASAHTRADFRRLRPLLLEVYNSTDSLGPQNTAKALEYANQLASGESVNLSRDQFPYLIICLGKLAGAEGRLATDNELIDAFAHSTSSGNKDAPKALISLSTPDLLLTLDAKYAAKFEDEEKTRATAAKAAEERQRAQAWLDAQLGAAGTAIPETAKEIQGRVKAQLAGVAEAATELEVQIHETVRAAEIERFRLEEAARLRIESNAYAAKLERERAAEDAARLEGEKAAAQKAEEEKKLDAERKAASEQAKAKMREKTAIRINAGGQENQAQMTKAAADRLRSPLPPNPSSLSGCKQTEFGMVCKVQR